MQVAVSIAVIFAALSVVTGSGEAPASTSEPTLAQKFEKFQEDAQTFVEHVGEKTKAALHDLHHSEFANKTRSWFSENFQKLKEKIKATFPSEGSN